MASDPNIELVREVFEAFSKHDVDAALTRSDPGIEFVLVTPSLTGASGPYRGHEGVQRYFDDVENQWEELRVSPQRYRRAGDSVVAVGRIYARGRDGHVVDSPGGWIWRIREGKVVEGKMFSSPQDALAAAGMDRR
jgi:ketosteroid isomerase-like protein